MRLLAAAAILAFMGACDRKPDAVRVVTPKPAIAIAAPASVPWRAALASSFDTTPAKSDEQGVTEFVACFQRADKRCPAAMFGRYDAFAKVTTFAGMETSLDEIAGEHVIGTHLYVRDCGAPVLMLTTQLTLYGGWAFLNRSSFLADGAPALELKADPGRVTRETYPNAVRESFRSAVTGEQEVALRRMLTAKTILIRASGERGHVNFEPRAVAHFKSDIAVGLAALDALRLALNKPGVERCAE